MAGNKKRKRIDRSAAVANASALMGRLMAVRIAREPMTESEVGRVELCVLTAIESIAKGHGTGDNWDAIAKALNQSWIFATEAGTGEEAKPYLLVAQDGMNRMKRRFLETGKMEFDDLALEAVRSAVELWRDQLRMSSVAELRAATDVVQAHFYQKEAV